MVRVCNRWRMGKVIAFPASSISDLFRKKPAATSSTVAVGGTMCGICGCMKARGVAPLPGCPCACHPIRLKLIESFGGQLTQTSRSKGLHCALGQAPRPA